MGGGEVGCTPKCSPETTCTPGRKSRGEVEMKECRHEDSKWKTEVQSAVQTTNSLTSVVHLGWETRVRRGLIVRSERSSFVFVKVWLCRERVKTKS